MSCVTFSQVPRLGLFVERKEGRENPGRKKEGIMQLFVGRNGFHVCLVIYQPSQKCIKKELCDREVALLVDHKQKTTPADVWEDGHRCLRLGRWSREKGHGRGGQLAVRKQFVLSPLRNLSVLSRLLMFLHEEDLAGPKKGPQLFGDKRSLTWGVRPHLLALCSPSGLLGRRHLAPFLGSGLALLAPNWRLPAQTPALALRGGTFPPPET